MASLVPRLADMVEAIERICNETAGVPLDAVEADWRKRRLMEICREELAKRQAREG